MSVSETCTRKAREHVIKALDAFQPARNMSNATMDANAKLIAAKKALDEILGE